MPPKPPTNIPYRQFSGLLDLHGKRWAEFQEQLGGYFVFRGFGPLACWRYINTLALKADLSLRAPINLPPEYTYFNPTHCYTPTEDPAARKLLWRSNGTIYSRKVFGLNRAKRYYDDARKWLGYKPSNLGVKVFPVFISLQIQSKFSNIEIE
jgi:hypothetical protein